MIKSTFYKSFTSELKKKQIKRKKKSKLLRNAHTLDVLKLFVWISSGKSKNNI